MRFQDYRTLFQVASLASVLLAASPALSLIVPFPTAEESFSELWLLGPNHIAKDYPFNIHTREDYTLFLGIGNHLGHSAYYLTYIKFRNQTQSLPSTSNSEPSPLPPLSELRCFLADGQTWESIITFEILDASIHGDSLPIRNVSINDVTFSVDCFSRWDSENNGFYYQLFFELWLYSMASQSFQYHNRLVGIWFNVTIS